MNLFLLNDSRAWEMHTYTNLSELMCEFKKRNIQIGENCTIGERCELNNEVTIGANCTFGENCEIRRYAEIGENCTFGENCTIDYRAVVRNNAVIGKFGVLGSESLIGSYANIGAYCIVKVGATVAPLFIVEEFETYKNSDEVPYRHTDFQKLLHDISKLY